MSKNQTKKTQPRELKVLMDADTRKLLQNVVGGYGNTIKLANATGVNRVTIKNAVNDGRATPNVIKELMKGIKVLQKQQTA